MQITLFDPNTGEEFQDNSKVISRNTLVLVKRIPATKLKPLSVSAPKGSSGGDGLQPVGMTGSTPATATTISGVIDRSSPRPAAGNGPTGEFGEDVYAERPAAGVMGADEGKALQNLLQGTAATWQREVRQGALRGRGRGRGRSGPGGIPPEYVCPRCGVAGQHWLQDCPTQGDPAYDRKRVRPPVGIPMTRLARSQEGGLVLPDGQTGTLVANEDAFAREILGLGLLPGDQMTEEESHQAIEDGKAAQDEPVMALEYPSAIESGKTARYPSDLKTIPAETTQKASSVRSHVATAPSINVPTLVGDEELHSYDSDDETPAEEAAMPGAGFFDMMLREALLPRGPTAFLERCFNGDQPLSRSEFEKGQDEYRKRYNLAPLSRRGRADDSQLRGRSRSRSRPHSKSRSRSESRRSRRHTSSRRESRSRTMHRSRSSRRRRSRTRSRSKTRREHRTDRSRSRRHNRSKSKGRISSRRDSSPHRYYDRDDPYRRQERSRREEKRDDSKRRHGRRRSESYDVARDKEKSSNVERRERGRDDSREPSRRHSRRRSESYDVARDKEKSSNVERRERGRDDSREPSRRRSGRDVKSSAVEGRNADGSANISKDAAANNPAKDANRGFDDKDEIEAIHRAPKEQREERDDVEAEHQDDERADGADVHATVSKQRLDVQVNRFDTIFSFFLTLSYIVISCAQVGDERLDFV